MFPSKKTTDLQQQVEDLRLEIAKRDAKIDILEAQQTIVVNNVGDPSAAEKLAAGHDVSTVGVRPLGQPPC